jgi:hypothetical protein
MEGQESEAKANRSRRPSLVVKPTHGGIWKTGVKVDWTLSSDRKDKTGIVLFGQRRRQGARAFLECRQSSSFLYLANSVNRGAL